MVTICFRTILIYGCLIAAMRFMGKRQLGELEISDLVTTLLVSEISALPVTNPELPLSYALVPLLILVSLEVLLSGALLRFPRLKQILSAPPAILVRNGVPDRQALLNSRISPEELFSRLRQKEAADLAGVAYAILEPNGQLSVLPAKPGDAGGLTYVVVSDGVINERNLSLIGRDRAWLLRQLEERGVPLGKVFLVTVRDDGWMQVIRREDV